ncbi:MAG: hypothetical protein CL578_22675 [Alteromonadaceae bacterium]|nr:hypothetical protein [Alteromonadaceae bacterium]|tara:strand:+ start:3750 stop:3968 length:219 start_codon:yes stop_codon:yes gene_type:complete
MLRSVKIRFLLRDGGAGITRIEDVLATEYAGIPYKKNETFRNLNYFYIYWKLLIKKFPVSVIQIADIPYLHN